MIKKKKKTAKILKLTVKRESGTGSINKFIYTAIMLHNWPKFQLLMSLECSATSLRAETESIV